MNIPSTSFRPTKLPGQERLSNLRFQGAAAKPVQIAAEKVEATGAARFFIGLEKFKKKKGDEAVNIVVNSIGTGVVAPLVIALNKFNDEDKHTKIYSAMRQPISAILGFLTQIGINAPVPRMVDRLARRGTLGDHFLGPLRTIHDNASAEDSLEREAKNKYLRSQYERVIKDPQYREKVAKLLNISIMEEHANQVSMARKGRSSYPPAAKLIKAADVTVEHAMKYNSKRLTRLTYLTMFILSVITLYPTCVLLNWMYPRIMNLFPSLTEEDKKPNQAKHA